MSNLYHQSFTVFNALADGFRVMKNEFSFFGILIILYAILASLPYVLFLDDFSDPEIFFNLVEQGDFPFLIFYVFYYVLYGIVIIITLDKTHATYNDIEFENYPYISRAVKAVLPVIGIYIISMILSFLGFILLIVPGIIVFLTLYLSIPAK